MAWLRRLAPSGTTGSRRPTASVGVHLSADRLAAVRVRAASPLPVLEEVRQQRLEPGKTTSAVRTLAQGDFVKGARVILTLAAGKYETIAIASPPAVPEDELRDALRWQLRGTLAYPPDEAAFDFLRLPNSPGSPAGGASPNSGVLVIATRRDEVATAVAPFLASGIEVDVVDIPEMSQRNLLGDPGKQDACRAFLSFDDTSSLLTVQLGDDLCFSRRMQLPGAGGLGADEPEHQADRIATNVQRTLEVFARQSNLPDVATLTVGPHQHCAMIARAVQEQAEVNTILFDPSAVVANSQALLAESGASDGHLSGELAIALGAALRHDGERRGAASALALPAWLRREKQAA